MIGPFFLNRKYFLRCYPTLVIITALLWYETDLGIKLLKILGEIQQMVSDCEYGSRKYSLDDFIKFAVAKLLPSFFIITGMRCFSSYLVNVFVFYWRQALTEYYIKSWNYISEVEGASQRIQEDTAKWARELRLCSFEILNASLTFFKIIPELNAMSSNIPEIFLIGKVKNGVIYPPFFILAVELIVIAASSYKLPYLHFENQKLEAKYRKILALNEDEEGAVEKEELDKVYAELTKNYYRTFKFTFPFLYLHVMTNDLGYFSGPVFIWPSFFHKSMTVEDYSTVSRFLRTMFRIFMIIQARWRGFTELISVYRRLSDFEHRIDIAEKDGVQLTEIDLD
ncbi:transport protein [Cryptosporidium ryanae]|uniref:transport protein n=1 Tax=Cryptosporidium ryanae TaxID=515981 RepID=UPI00351A6BB9|nr:transport protein [Cryptosporidium ryanae]